MRILVTGATGFIGPHVLRACHNAGHETISLARSKAPTAAISCIADLLDASAVDEAMATHRPDGVIHLAGRVGIRPGDDLSTLYRINVVGTAHVLRALERHAPQAQVVHVGSAAQYGAIGGEAAVDETVSCRPHSHYGLAKHAQEQMARSFYERGLNVVFVRTFNLTGPGDPPRSLFGKVAEGLALRKLGRVQGPLRTGALTAVRDVLDVRDAAAAYVQLLHVPTAGQAFNVCRGEGVEMHACITYLLEAAGLPASTIDVAPSVHAVPSVSRIVGDASAMQAATGWQPLIPLHQSLADLYADWERRVREQTS